MTLNNRSKLEAMGIKLTVLHFQIVPGHSGGEMKRCLPLFLHRGRGESIKKSYFIILYC